MLVPYILVARAVFTASSCVACVISAVLLALIHTPVVHLLLEGLLLLFSTFRAFMCFFSAMKVNLVNLFFSFLLIFFRRVFPR